MADFEAERALLHEALDAWLPSDGVKALRIAVTVEDGRTFGFDAFPIHVSAEEHPLGFTLTLQSTGRLEKATKEQ